MEFLSPVSTYFQNEGEIGNESWPFSLSTDHTHPFIFASAHLKTSLKMLKHCAVTVVTDTEIGEGVEVSCWIIYLRLNHRRLLDLKPIFRKKHGPLYQFEFRNRWAGAYRSMGTKRDE